MIGESLYHVAWQLVRPEIRRSESEVSTMRIQLFLSAVVVAGSTGCSDSPEPVVTGNAASTAQPSSDSTAATPQPTASTEKTGTSQPNGGEAKQPPLNDPPTEESADKPADKPSYRIVETKSDGGRVIEYAVTIPVSEQRTRINASGQEEVYTVTITVQETRQTVVPAGQDIDEFLKGKATDSGTPPAAADPAPVPTVP